jgi:AraC-like DNA-binding protein
MERLEHAQWVSEMSAQPTLARRILVLERCVARLLSGRMAPRADVIYSQLRRLVSEGRGPKVSLAAKRLGVSERQLERVCRTAFGLSPSHMFRLMRLHSLSGPFACSVHGSAALAELASRVGFSDASHLSREVSALTGMPASRWRALMMERKPSEWTSWLLAGLQPRLEQGFSFGPAPVECGCQVGQLHCGRATATAQQWLSLTPGLSTPST